MEDLLNVNLEFIGVNYDYAGVGNYIRQYVTAASNDYDLFINDIYGTASLTLEGAFLNALGLENFDFSRPWWYADFMRDISMNYSYQFMLAGDFFIDVLRSSHVLLFNKSLYTDLFGNGDEIYEIVLNGDWTYDRFVQICEESFADLNGDGKNDPNDRYGYVAYQSWGPMIPFLISANPGYVERDEQGYPTITVYNERSLALMDYLIKIFNSPAAGALTVFHDDSEATLLNFTSGRSVMIGDQRIGSLENARIRDMEQDFAVLPYPKLTELDDYVTSAHDTSEVGLIPITVSPDSTGFISAVIEVLCRETHKEVLPVYYDSSIKMKYTRDQNSAQMIDIIHDNIGDSFPLAWSNELEAIFLQGTFYYAVVEDGDFASRYKRLERVGTKKLEKLISTLEKSIGE